MKASEEREQANSIAQHFDDGDINYQIIII